MNRKAIVLAVLFAVPALRAESPADVQGRALAKRVAATIGISKPVKSLRASFQQGDGANASQIEATIVFPDHMRADIRSPRGPLTVVFTPQDAFSLGADGASHDLPPQARAEGLAQVLRDPIYLCSHVKDHQVEFTAAGEERIGDVRARIVEVNAAGTRIRWYVDPNTALILRESYQTVGPRGPVASSTELSDWRELGGLKLPARHQNYQDGKLASVVIETGLQLNPGVNPAIFNRPPAKPQN